jgi:hypothetical protein
MGSPATQTSFSQVSTPLHGKRSSQSVFATQGIPPVSVEVSLPPVVSLEPVSVPVVALSVALSVALASVLSAPEFDAIVAPVVSALVVGAIVVVGSVGEVSLLSELPPEAIDSVTSSPHAIPSSTSASVGRAKVSLATGPPERVFGPRDDLRFQLLR